MFDKEFWNRQYKFKINQELKEVIIDMWPYVVIMVIWYCVIPLILALIGRITIIYSLGYTFVYVQKLWFNPLFWFAMGYFYQMDKGVGCNYFIVVSVLVFIVTKLFLLVTIEGSAYVFTEWISFVVENRWMLLFYIISSKLGMKLA